MVSAVSSSELPNVILPLPVPAAVVEIWVPLRVMMPVPAEITSSPSGCALPTAWSVTSPSGVPVVSRLSVTLLFRPLTLLSKLASPPPVVIWTVPEMVTAWSKSSVPLVDTSPARLAVPWTFSAPSEDRAEPAAVVTCPTWESPSKLSVAARFRLTVWAL